MYLARLRGKSKQEAAHAVSSWLERMDVNTFAARKLETLSKGQQQKVQFAAALMVDAPVLLLDEPFSGLDPLNIRLFTALVADARENRMLEVLLTSVRAESLVAGKVLGLASAGFLRVLAYSLVAFATAGTGLLVPDLQPRFLIAATVCFLTGYTLFAVLMGVTGAIARSSQESMQMGFR